RDDDKRHPKQDVHEKRLPGRIATTGHGWGQKEAAADPSDSDPDDGCLNMHVAQEIEWQVVVEFEPVEAGPVVIGMGHNCPCQDLNQQHCGHDDKILSNLFLAWGQRSEFGKSALPRLVVRRIEPKLVNEQNAAKGEKREAEARPSPNERVGGWRVADLWLV